MKKMKFRWQPPVPLSKEEKKEAKLIAVIVVLLYVLALGYYLS